MHTLELQIVKNLDFFPLSDTLGVFFGLFKVNFFKNFCAWVMSQCNQGSPSFKKKKKKETLQL
jgi:hypothetical protein